MSRCRVHQQGPLTLYAASAVDDQLYVTVSVAEGAADAARASADAYRQIGELLARESMQIVHERIFGSLHAEPEVIGARRDALSQTGIPPRGPITYVQGRPPWGEGLAGVQLFAVRPREHGAVRTVQEEGVPCGSGWERGGAKFVVLQGIHGDRAAEAGSGGPEAQAERMFDRADGILRSQGLAYSHVARTWIYLSNILDWYEGFNEVRNAKYGQLGLMPDLTGGGSPEEVRLPASTGIEGDSASGAACVMDLLAVAGDRARVALLGNVRQTDAFRYGSAFSRGSCIREADVTRVDISGTAAIGEQGRTQFPGDARGQILWTLDTVESLIAQEGATLQDICQATVFLKRAEDHATYREAAGERGLAEMPAVCVLADVCRDDLLFEMDGVAAVRAAR